MTTDGLELEASIAAAKPEDDAIEARRLHATMRERLLGRPADPPRVGRYVVLRRSGAGGMGVVYEAYDPLLDRKVALKSVAIARVARDHDIAGEGRAMAQVVHPNVVRVFDVWRDHDVLFIAMEFVDGRTLEQWLRVEPRPRAEILAAFVAAGRGLAAVHEAGLVHGDVKPANVLVADDGRVLLVDFGLAALGHEHARIRGGTPAFMAPEQRARGIMAASADQYSFCAGLVEALRGRGRHGTARSVRRVLERGLADDPDARWSSMDALLIALASASTRARRTRRAVLATACVVVAASLATATLAENPCATLERHAGARWAAARSDVEQAFLATGLPDATWAFGHVDAGAVRYAEEWDDASTALCRASFGGELEDDEVDRQRRCLDRALIGFTTTADRWSTAGAEQVDRALDALAAIPEVQSCARGEHDHGLPTDTEARRQVLELRDELVRAKATAEAGDTEAAAAMAEPIVEVAESIGFAPVIAEARALRGSVRNDRGDYLDATIDLTEAFTQAHAAGRDDLAAPPALELAYISGVRLSQSDRATWWLRHAQAALAHVDDAKLHAEAITVESDLAAVRGDLGRARELAERGQRAIEAAHGAHAPQNGQAIAQLAAAELAVDHAPEAIALYERSCEILIASRGRMHPTALVCAANLATAQGRRGDWAAALGTFEELVDLWDAREPRAIETAVVHGNLGTVLTNLGETEAGRVQLERALAILQDSGLGESTDAASIHVALGYNARVRGDIPEGRAQVHAALVTFERVGLADSEAAGYAHQHLGDLAIIAGDLEGALVEFLRCRAIFAAIEPDHRFLALVEAGIGEIRMQRGELDEAIATLESAERRLSTQWELPDQLANLRFALASSLGERNEAGDDARARELAELSLAHHDTVGNPEAAEVRAWLSARRSSPR